MRASEVCDLRWEQIDWKSATLHVCRVKSGKPSTHPIRGDELAGDGHDTRSIQDYLGHKNIQHTVRYTELSPTKFKDFWRDCLAVVLGCWGAAW
jgi:integrase